MRNPLIYGTAGLHRLATHQQRQRALAAVYDAGIRAFDVAPAYGNGIDEVEVGIALHEKRATIEINTKYGIPVAMYGGFARYAFALWRLADRLTGQSARAYRHRDYSSRELARSLDESLRRLRTDHVDCLFVHEPITPLSPAELADIVDAGRRMKSAGKIRALGIAGPARSLSLCPSLVEFDVVQTRRADLSDAAHATHDKPLILYGMYEAYRASQGSDFRQFVEQTLTSRERLRIIVASRHLETIRSFRGLSE
jgi:aryl-alcohol dehydrogenase-like predicted oxidoreductase